MQDGSRCRGRTEGEQRGHRGNCYALIMIEGDRGWGEDGRSGCEVPGLRD